MNEETFTNYLKEISTLYKVPYEELKTLVHQYPYCQNLHHLLLEKSKLEDHEQLEYNLHRAAAHSNDRRFLFKKFQHIQKATKAEESILAHEDYLELPDLKTLGSPLPPLVSTNQAQDGPLFTLSFESSDQPPAPSDHAPPFHEQPESPPIIEPDHRESLSPLPERALLFPQQEPWTLPEELITAIATALRVMDTLFFRPKNMGQKADRLLFPAHGKEEWPNGHSPGAGPSPKTSFPSWVQQFQPNHVKLQLSELMEAKKLEENKTLQKQSRKAAKGTNPVVEQVVRQSIMENDHLASETLAELLIAQMQYEKAISVYQRLILKFPEKRAFFAEKISNLKKLMV